MLRLLPALLCFVLGNDATYLKQAFVAGYLVIVRNRIGPSPTQVLLQAALIAASILAFILAAYTFPPASYLGGERASEPRAKLIQMLLQYPAACIPPTRVCC